MTRDGPSNQSLPVKQSSNEYEGYFWQACNIIYYINISFYSILFYSIILIFHFKIGEDWDVVFLYIFF